MASHGIRDKVAIVGMGCTPFGERWDKSAEDLLVDAGDRGLHDVRHQEGGRRRRYWLGTMGSGISGLTLSRPLKIDYKPVTRLENMCATGSEAFRNAAYAVAAGAIDVAMAIGVEKLKDSGFSGLTGSAPPNDGTLPTMTAPASFSLLAPAYAKKYGVDDAEMKEVLHAHRVEEPQERRAQPACAVQEGSGEGSHLQLAARRRPARHLRLLGRERRLGRRADRSRPKDAHKYCENPLYVKALSFVAGPAAGSDRPDLRLHVVHRGRALRRRRLQAGRHREPPRRARHGRGARLLHAHRARAHGRPRVRRARHGLEGSARGHVSTSTATSR